MLIGLNTLIVDSSSLSICFLSSLSIKFNDATISYGLFIQSIVDFLIVAAAVFVMLKVITKLSNLRKQEEKTAE